MQYLSVVFNVVFSIRYLSEEKKFYLKLNIEQYALELGTKYEFKASFFDMVTISALTYREQCNSLNSK